MNDFGAVERPVMNLLAGDAGAELEGSGELRGLGQTEAVFFRELAHWQAAKSAQRAVFADQPATNFNGAAAASTGGDEKRHQLGIVEGGRPEVSKFFARTLTIRHVLDPRAFGNFFDIRKLIEL